MYRAGYASDLQKMGDEKLALDGEKAGKLILMTDGSGVELTKRCNSLFQVK